MKKERERERERGGWKRGRKGERDRQRKRECEDLRSKMVTSPTYLFSSRPT